MASLLLALGSVFDANRRKLGNRRRLGMVPQSDRMATEGVQHIELAPQCGVCADNIQANETAVALYRSSGNRSRPASYQCSPPFSFPSRDRLSTFAVSRNAIERLPYCAQDECEACAASPEAAPAHRDCYEIFMQKGLCGDGQMPLRRVLKHKFRGRDRQPLLRRLLVLASWRRPWKEAQPLFLPGRIDKHALDAVAGLFGLPQLCELPVELLEMIRGHSEHSFFWRSISALRMAAYVLDTGGDEPLQQQSQVVALRDVVSWERGGNLDKSEGESQVLPPVIRLMMDCDGISKVERLSSHPSHSRGNHTHNAYIVGSDSDAEFSTLEVELIDNLLRLKLPPSGYVPQIWNTPNPPQLSSCNISPYEPSETWSRLFAIDSDSIRGLTFFVNQGRLCDLHVHYPEGPSAQATYNQMKPVDQRNMTWLYLPIPQGDRLTVVGVRQQRDRPSCYLFRSEKSGDFIIGARAQARGSSSKDKCLGRGAPLTFIYGEPNRGGTSPRVELVGAYCGESPASKEELRLPEGFPLDKYEPSPLSDLFMQAEYFSWAPLDGVTSTLVFRDESTGCCRGILLHYLDGGSRALGECRLHVEPAERVANPGVLCVQTECRLANWNRNLLLYRSRASFRHSQDDNHDHNHVYKDSDDGYSVDSEWKCHPMAGFARFWFTAESTFLSVTTDQHMETAAQS